MTQKARITQADIERAMKSVKRAGIEKARFVLNFEHQTITIHLGEEASPTTSYNEWNDEDI